MAEKNPYNEFEASEWANERETSESSSITLYTHIDWCSR